MGSAKVRKHKHQRLDGQACRHQPPADGNGTWGWAPAVSRLYGNVAGMAGMAMWRVWLFGLGGDVAAAWVGELLEAADFHQVAPVVVTAAISDSIPVVSGVTDRHGATSTTKPGRRSREDDATQMMPGACC